MTESQWQRKEDTKNIKEENKSPELKEELSEEELMGLSGGAGVSGILSEAKGLLDPSKSSPGTVTGTPGCEGGATGSGTHRP